MTCDVKVTQLPDFVERQLEYLLMLLDPVPKTLLREIADNQNSLDIQLQGIADWLYEYWYTTGAALNLKKIDSEITFEQDLSSWLKENAASSKKWEDGWIVAETSPTGYCIAGKGNLFREFFPGDYVNTTRYGLPPAPGDRITIMSLRYGTDKETGFWHTESSLGFPESPLSRFYLNINWRNAGSLVNHITVLLDDMSVQYSLKCPSNPKNFNRVDSLVVYIDRSDVDVVMPRLIEVLSDCTDRINPVGPPLTKEISPYIYFADDPHDEGDSFGTSRCKALAVGVYNFIRNAPENSDGIKKLMMALLSNDIDPIRPWRC